ncbi:4c1c0749-3f0d-4a55-94ab-df64d9edd449 [Thermothielavioides terrestris]|uniref:non-specific serine/threonine protein kinase n=1 Tax=Thermothielavioides terrestris TaxID=2587410 RepID=A0A3S4EXV2_9PEZI|nr:4c1c0749-3f0d-4a55-94ab-df64d9edd449 [Thermothielavioides terrestris]
MAPPPTPRPASSGVAERPYHGGANGRAVVAAKVTPGTPRREQQALRQEKAVQDPGLRDYRLGDCIGKGAFGSVYKAFNWGTGEAVAIKQIKLADLPRSELRMIEAEIDLLKNLHHDNIVKYIGFVKTADCLNIILEYCENGSLHSICKAYGKFPENLVGVYMTQVLQGLQYLHDQGVIHRDIKGANILTTKDGTVKLADFGVSTSTLAGPDKEAQVVGTPYWMAPEIIQLSGATSASDIWSVGCTVIELLQGKPPYHNLAAMPALFAIVNDDHPPLPEGVSPAARDFLMQCFQKDPNLRVSARKLLRHAWITGCRRSDAPVSKAPANFSQAVEEVKQWNKALKSSENNLRVSTGSENGGPPGQAHRANLATSAKVPLAPATKQRSTADAFRSPEPADDDNWDNDFATTISQSALHLPHIKGQDNFGGLLSGDRLKAFASVDGQREDSENWDSSFGGELVTIKGLGHWSEMDLQEETIRPLPKKTEKTRESRLRGQEHHGHRRQRSGKGGSNSSQPKSPVKPLGTKFELPPRPDIIYREQSTEDYSDLFADNDHVFDRRLSLANKDTPQLFHPSDLTSSAPKSTQRPTGGSSTRRSKTTSPASASSSSRPALLPPAEPDPPVRRARSTVEITKFAEDEGDEDFSDIFGADGDPLVESEESDRGSETDGQVGGGGGGGGQLILSRLSNNSWLGDDEDEDDPFAMMDPGWDEMDLEANIARDRHARLAERVEELVRSMKITKGEEVVGKLAEDLLALLWENDEVKALIIGAHGLLPILEILETCTLKSRQHMILQLLKIVNAIILDDVELQENLCFVGGIPIVTKFAARQYSNEIRLEAAAFVRQMYQTSTLTLQMFVSAGGLNVLVEFLDEDYETSQDLVLIGVNGIWNVFELQGPTPKNDFCRIFSRSKILDPLAAILHKVLDEDRDELSELVEGRIVNIFYLFSQAEPYVKEAVAERQVLKTVLKDLRRMTPSHQITMLKFIKNMSMCSTVLDALHSADAIDFLIDVLSHSMKKGQKNFREISNQVLNTMFNLCRLSKERQEYAASNGIIPLLLKIMRTDRPPKEFVLPILCDMAHSGSKGRRYLWQNNGLDFYVSLLADQYWQVTALDAIFVWLQEETAKVESHLLDGNFTAAIISCFNPTKANAFDPNLLEPLLKLLRLSPATAASLAKAEMYAGIAQKLSHKKAVVRLNLLRLVRNIMDGCEANGLSMSALSASSTGRQLRMLFDDIQTLADKDPAVLVRNLASELIRSHIDVELQHDAMSLSGLGLGASTGPGSSAGSGPRSRSGPRRNTSYTPPGLHLSTSMPPTPTQGHRLTQSSSAYIEIAATPKRSAVGLTQERDPAFYRPRSRDGLPVTNIPRRVSDTPPAGPASITTNSNTTTTTSSSSSTATATTPTSTPAPPSKSRLPRTSTQYAASRPSLISAVSAPPPLSSGSGTPSAGRRESLSTSSVHGGGGGGNYKENVLYHNHHHNNYNHGQGQSQSRAGRIRSGSSVTVASTASSAGAGASGGGGGASQYSASPTGSVFAAGAGGAGSGGLMPPAV